MQTKAFLYAVNHALVSTLFHDLSWQWLCYYFMNKKDKQKDDPPPTIFDPGKTLLDTIFTYHVPFNLFLTFLYLVSNYLLKPAETLSYLTYLFFIFTVFIFILLKIWVIVLCVFIIFIHVFLVLYDVIAF